VVAFLLLTALLLLGLVFVPLWLDVSYNDDNAAYEEASTSNSVDILIFSGIGPDVDDSSPSASDDSVMLTFNEYDESGPKLLPVGPALAGLSFILTETHLFKLFE
jgi:hypothetical protein